MPQWGSIDEPWKQYAKWKNPWYFIPIMMTSPDSANSETDIDSWLLRDSGSENEKLLIWVQDFGVMKMLYNYIVVIVSQHWIF